jgi:DNA polymerase-3 subunit alpha
MVDDFIDRKHGRARIEYPHPALSTILKPTYGVILYQEQVMQIAQVLAGYTLGGADLLRRAIGKKKAEEMAKQRENFVKGAHERGVVLEVASYIFDLIEKFAGYGFNKSHSAAYALVSYQTAWLKAHYPAAFMAAVLSSEMDRTDKVIVLIDECRSSLGLNIALPDINLSEYRFTASSLAEIRYGLGAIKGAGEAAIKILLEERRRGGLYSDLFDLCQRVELRKMNRRLLDALVRSGALDTLGLNRATLAAQLPDALQKAEQLFRNNATGQNDLFGLSATKEIDLKYLLGNNIIPMAEWGEEERLRGEKETLGVYLTGHPFNQVAEELAALNITCLHKFAEMGIGSNHSVLIAGLVVSVRTRNTNRGGRILFITLDDGGSRTEIRIFPELYERYHQLIVEDRILLIYGNLVWDEFHQKTRFNVEQILDLDQARAMYARWLILKLDIKQCKVGLQHLSEILAEHRANGSCIVKIKIDYVSEGAQVELTCGSVWKINPSKLLLSKLEDLPFVVGKVRLLLSQQ